MLCLWKEGSLWQFWQQYFMAWTQGRHFWLEKVWCLVGGYVLPILAFFVKNFRGNTILRCNLFTVTVCWCFTWSLLVLLSTWLTFFCYVCSRTLRATHAWSTAAYTGVQTARSIARGGVVLQRTVLCPWLLWTHLRCKRWACQRIMLLWPRRVVQPMSSMKQQRASTMTLRSFLYRCSRIRTVLGWVAWNWSEWAC